MFFACSRKNSFRAEKNITVNNIPFFLRIVIRFIILNCELFVILIQDFATGMYMETKETDDNMVIKRRLRTKQQY